MPHFYQAHIKGIKSDFVKGEITIGFVVDFDEGNAELARELSHYAEAAAGDVEVVITPRQISLLDNAIQVTEEGVVVPPEFQPDLDDDLLDPDEDYFDDVEEEETVSLHADDPEDPLDDDLLTIDEEDDVIPIFGDIDEEEAS